MSLLKNIVFCSFILSFYVPLHSMDDQNEEFFDASEKVQAESSSDELVTRERSKSIKSRSRSASCSSLEQELDGISLDESGLPEKVKQNILSLSEQEIHFIEPKFYAYMVKGKSFAEKIASGNVLSFDKLDDYLDAIIDVMWFFYGEAVGKGQAFNEGAFVIEDEGFKFYDFLMRYVKLRNSDIKDDPEKDQALMKADNDFGYSRLSSHLTYFQYKHNDVASLYLDGKYRHYGIDIRWEKGGSVDNDELPTGDKSHILFGKMGVNLLYIKLEDYGIGKNEVVYHAVGYAGSVVTKVTPALGGGTTAVTTAVAQESPSPVSESLSKSKFCLPGTGDDQPSYRKERIPKAFSLEIKNIVESSSFDNRNKEILKNVIKIFGIRGLYWLLNSNKKEISKILISLGWKPSSDLTYERVISLSRGIKKDEKLFAVLKGLLQELERCYDNLSLRTGREVIITQKELKESFKAYEEAESFAQKSRLRLENKEEKKKRKITAEEVFGERLRIYNDSGYRLELTVNSKKDGQLFKRVLEKGASVDVGLAKYFKRGSMTVAYKTYGRTKELGRKIVRGVSKLLPSQASLEDSYEIKANDLEQHTFRANEFIKISLQPDFNYSVTVVRAQKRLPFPKDNDPYNAFPGLIYWSSKNGYFNLGSRSIKELLKDYPHDFPRYVLGLPENPDEKSIESAYERLSQEWDIDLYVKECQLVAKINEILKASYDILHSQKVLQADTTSFKENNVEDDWTEVEYKK